MDIKNKTKQDLEFSILDLTQEIVIYRKILDSKIKYKSEQQKALDTINSVVFCEEEIHRDGSVYKYKPSFPNNRHNKSYFKRLIEWILKK